MGSRADHQYDDEKRVHICMYTLFTITYSRYAAPFGPRLKRKAGLYRHETCRPGLCNTPVPPISCRVVARRNLYRSYEGHRTS